MEFRFAQSLAFSYKTCSQPSTPDAEFLKIFHKQPWAVFLFGFNRECAIQGADDQDSL
jgi:hypothetical protein